PAGIERPGPNDAAVSGVHQGASTLSQGQSSTTTVSIQRASRMRATISLPGDKSISHRSAMISALGNGESRISNYSTARDCASTLSCLETLGVETRREGGIVIVRGRGLEGLHESKRTLDAGNSGSTIRMLSGILAGQPFTTRISGDQSIQRRPMNRVIGPL